MCVYVCLPRRGCGPRCTPSFPPSLLPSFLPSFPWALQSADRLDNAEALWAKSEDHVRHIVDAVNKEKEAQEAEAKRREMETEVDKENVVAAEAPGDGGQQDKAEDEKRDALSTEAATSDFNPDPHS
eukprot:GHVU01013468.1.p1 GENE.GHVU01013468.1~~GHVU01013468.1.p1  ORF type:complete len:127 (+),score=32.62 GHVU01013468.1:514-894(+)